MNTSTRKEDKSMADHNLEHISDLIQKTDDPQTRAVLLILYKIADTLQQNSQVTNQILTDLKSQDTAINNLAKDILVKTSSANGSSKILKWILPLSQSILLGACAYFYVDYSELKSSVVEIKTTLNFIISQERLLK